MPPTFCPSCGTPNAGAFRYCATCQFDFDLPAHSPAPQPASSLTTPQPVDPPFVTETYAGSGWSRGQTTLEEGVTPVDGGPGAIERNGRSRILFAAIAVVVVVALVLEASGALSGGRASGGPSAADLPPPGSIWFGRTLDPTTFALSGRTTTAATDAPLAFVARLTRSAKGSEMTMRWSWNGSLVTNTGLRWDGEGEVWGGSAGPVSEPGDWRLELTDVGGNTLASGTLVVTRDDTAAN